MPGICIRLQGLRLQDCAGRVNISVQSMVRSLGRIWCFSASERVVHFGGQLSVLVGSEKQKDERWVGSNPGCVDPVWLQRLRGSNPGQLDRRPAPRVWHFDIRPAVEQDLHDTDRFMEFN